MARVNNMVDRNGEVVPFRRSRVVRAILAAVRSAGSSEEWVADKLADMVVYFLDLNHGGRPVPPSADDVDDTIEKALLSTPDLGAVSQAFMVSRRQRKDLREIEDAAQPTTGPEVAQSGQALEGWNRARIAAALVRENGLSATRAAEVAFAVEQRVAGLSLPRLTTGLIRELVDVELIARGLAAQPSTLAVPRYDVEQWLFPADDNDAYPAPHQGELGQRAAGRVLGEYALASILPLEARELHLQGRVVFDGLETPAAVASLRLDAVACVAEGAGFGMARIYPDVALSSTGTFARLAALVRDAAAFTSGPIVLRQLDAAFAADADPDRAALQEGLRLLAGQAPNLLRIEVGPPSPTRDLVIRALMDGLAADAALRQRVSIELAISPGAFADAARKSTIERAAAHACYTGEPSFRLREPLLNNPGGLFGDPSGPRHGVVLARASLNLVAPALAAANLSAYLAAVEPLIDGAAAGLAARARFIERVALRNLGEPVPHAARMMRAAVGASREVELAPVGLFTAAAMLCGTDAGAEVARTAQQIMSYLAFRFRDAAGRANLNGVVGAFDGDAGGRMARADIGALGRSDPDSPKRGRLGADGAYLPGAAMPLSLAAAVRLPVEAALHQGLGRDAALVVGADEPMDGATLAALLRAALAEGAPRPTRVVLSVRHRVCRDCGARSLASVEACPACGSTAWAVPPGQKSLFG